MLEAQGYPEKKGALEAVHKHLKVPKSTLRGWFNETNNPPSAELRTEKRGDLSALITNEIHNILAQMPDAIGEANYKDLATALGILTDKKQLLEGKATSINDIRTNEDRANRIIEFVEQVRPRGNRPFTQ